LTKARFDAPRSLFERRSACFLNAMEHQGDELVVHAGFDQRSQVDLRKSLEEQLERVGQRTLLLRWRQIGGAFLCRPSCPSPFESALEPSRPRVLFQPVGIALQPLHLPFIEPVNAPPVSVWEEHAPLETANGRDAFPKASGDLNPRERHAKV